MDSQPDGHRIIIRGLNIHYQCLGKGPGVILLHGGGSDWHEWQRNIHFFSQNFQVYVPDLPGFGLSDTPKVPVTPRWYSTLLNDFIKQLGITHAHIIGHSLGGTITLSFALEHPEMVNKTVIVDSGGLGQMDWKGRLTLLIVRGLERIIGRWENPKCQFGGTKEDWLFINDLPKLGQPVEIIWGRWDPYLPVSQAKLAQRLIPNCRLHVFSNCGHAPQRCRPDEFNDVVYRFLTER